MVSKRAVLLLLALPLVLCVSSANAQGDFKFLGNTRQVQDQFSPKYHIRYNTQGFDQPRPNWSKKIAKMQKKKVPEYAINEILQFPGSPDAISRNWQVTGYPALFLIDHKGVIRQKWRGNPGDQVLDAAIEKLVREAEGEKGKKG